MKSRRPSITVLLALTCWLSTSTARADLLSSETLRFIELYRGDGNTFAHPSQLLNMTHTLRRDVGRGGRLARFGVCLRR